MNSKKENSIDVASKRPLNIEEVLLAFETAWFEGRQDAIEDFLPPESDPAFQDLLTELVRTDMEFHAEKGLPFAASQYLKRFPQINNNPDSKKAIVFEEYRLCHSSGQAIQASELGLRYDVDTTGWPLLESASLSKSESADGDHSKIEFPNVGDFFDGFELVGVLGKGAFGHVYLAHQSDLEGRLVVLKITSIQTDEHKLLARLQHTNIVPIHSIHRQQDLQAICMPLLGVATLEDILASSGSEDKRSAQSSHALVKTVHVQREETVVNSIKHPVKRESFRARTRLSAERGPSRSDLNFKEFAIQFFQQTAEGLGYAHERGIVHGDLKPANLLLNDDGDAVILDFHLGSSHQESLGQHVGGTLPYMAPEHLESFQNQTTTLSPASDVYSIGIMIFETLTGRLPFDFDSDQTLSPRELLSRKQSRVALPAADRKKIGQDMAAIIETCISPQPKRRYLNGGELANDLERAAKFQPLLRARNGTIGNRITKWAKRHPRLSSSTSILLLSGFVIALLLGSYWSVANSLAQREAVQTSEENISRFGEIQASLAAFHVFHDASFFEATLDKADSISAANEWVTQESLNNADHFLRLSQTQSETEKLTAGELKFLQAAACLKLAENSNHPENWLDRAKAFNTLSSEFWPDGKSRIAIDAQKQQIEEQQSGHTNSKLPILPDAAPDNRHDQVMLAHLIQQDAQKAETIYRTLAESEPGNFLAWLGLANACVALGKDEQGIAHYSMCHVMNPNSHLPLLYRGKTHFNQGRIKEAIEDFQRAEAQQPDDVTTLLNLGLALGKTRNFKLALEKYDRAIELGANQTRALLLRSQLKNALRDRKGSAEDLEAFLTTEPADELSWVARGVYKTKRQQDHAGAISDFESALKHNKNSVSALNNLAHVYGEVLSQTEQAIGYMDRLVEAEPGNAKFISERGILHSRIGNREKAIADAKVALNIDSSPDTMYRVAGIYAQTSQLVKEDGLESFRLFSQAASENPRLVLKELSTDPDIKPLLNEPDFSGLIGHLNGLVPTTEKSSPKK